MSTNYVMGNHGEFTKNDVFVAMKKNDFTIAKQDGDNFCITNGNVYVWCYPHTYETKEYVSFTRYGGNYDAEQEILQPIAEHLKTALISEHDREDYAEIMGFDQDEE